MDQAPYDIYRNATSLVFVPSDADALLASDALDSALLAQLDAGTKAEPFADPQRWNRTRLATLNKMGWVATSTEAAESVKEGPFTLAGLLALEATDIAMGQLAEALTPLLLPETWLEGLWARRSNGVVQVRANVMEVGRNGELAWTCLSFTASSSFGWCGPYSATQDTPVSVRIVRSRHAFSDGANGYAHIRENVIEALGARRYSQNQQIAINAVNEA